jgi:hypothetical protein
LPVSKTKEQLSEKGNTKKKEQEEEKEPEAEELKEEKPKR